MLPVDTAALTIEPPPYKFHSPWYPQDRIDTAGPGQEQAFKTVIEWARQHCPDAIIGDGDHTFTIPLQAGRSVFATARLGAGSRIFPHPSSLSFSELISQLQTYQNFMQQQHSGQWFGFHSEVQVPSADWQHS